MATQIRSILCAALLLVTASAFAAPVLWIDDNFNQLGTVDVATGNTTLIGAITAAGQVTDLAFNPSGNLFATTFTGLYAVDRNTAVATLVGNYGGESGMNALVFAADGTLYGAANDSTALYRINTSTGALTFVGNTGFASAGDLAFNGGHLYLSSTSNQLIQINTTNPSLSFAVGSLGIGNVFGLATGDDGILYATSNNNVYTVNTSTGLATFKTTWAGHTPFLSQAFGTAFVTEAGAPGGNGVPEPGTYALMLTALGMLGYVIARKRKLQPAAT